MRLPGSGLLREPWTVQAVRWRCRGNGSGHYAREYFGWLDDRRAATGNDGSGGGTDVHLSLTVGEGLVAQAPALIVSTAAGIVITRAA